MARYNTAVANTTLSSSASVSAPQQGLFTKLTGSVTYTVTLPSPILYPGITQTYYNAASVALTLTTPSGVFTSNSTANYLLAAGNIIVLISDGTNYIPIISSGDSVTLNTVASGTIQTTTGQITTTPSNNTDIANKAYVDSKTRVSAISLYYAS